MDEEGKDMGRHRRSAAGRAATGRATGVDDTYGSHPDSHDPREELVIAGHVGHELEQLLRRIREVLRLTMTRH